MKLDVLDQLAPALQQASKVLLTGGGEPLLLSRLPDFIDRCHVHNSTLDVSFISNGVLLSEQKARMVIEKRVHNIDFSMDGTIQYGHVGGGSDYNKVKNNLRRLARLKEEYGVKEPHMGIDFVAMRDNLCELSDLIEFAAEIGAKVVFQPLAPTSEEQRNQNVFRHVAYTLRVLDECRSKAHQLSVQFDPLNMTPSMNQTTPRRCEQPFEWLWVSYSGDLAPCCGGMRTGRSVYEKGLSIEEVWNGPDLLRLRWELDTGNYNDICLHCPMLRNTVENQERAIQHDALEQIARLETRIHNLESHLQDIRRGRVMRVLRLVDRVLGKR